MKKLTNLLLIIGCLAGQNLSADSQDSLSLYQVGRDAEFYNIYRTPQQRSESLSQISNLKMGFRKLSVNEDARTITYGPKEAPAVEGLTNKELARLIDWNWARLQNVWFPHNHDKKVQLKNLDELTQDEVDFDLNRERENFKGFSVEAMSDSEKNKLNAAKESERKKLSDAYQSELSNIHQMQKDKSISTDQAGALKQKLNQKYRLDLARVLGTPIAEVYSPNFQRHPSGRIILSFSEIERAEDGSLWLVFGDESEEARRGILDSSLSSWNEKVGAIQSFDYAFELGAFDFDVSRSD